MAISNYNEGGENGPFQKEELNNFLKETINNIESCVRQYQMDHVSKSHNYALLCTLIVELLGLLVELMSFSTCQTLISFP